MNKAELASEWLDLDESRNREGIYSPDERTDMLENDEISGWEAAFMDGYDESIA